MIRTFCWHFAKQFDSIYIFLSLSFALKSHPYRDGKHKLVVCGIVICFVAASESLCSFWLTECSHSTILLFIWFFVAQTQDAFLFRRSNESSKCDHTRRYIWGRGIIIIIIIIIIISFYVCEIVSVCDNLTSICLGRLFWLFYIKLIVLLSFSPFCSIILFFSCKFFQFDWLLYAVDVVPVFKFENYLFTNLFTIKFFNLLHMCSVMQLWFRFPFHFQFFRIRFKVI